MELGMGVLIFLTVMGILNLACGIHSLAEGRLGLAAVNLIPGTLCLATVIINSGV